MPQRRAPIARSCSKSSRSKAAASTNPPSRSDVPVPSNPHAENDLVTIGRIGRPHGLRGAVVVRADASALAVLRDGLRVAIAPEGGEPSWTSVRRVTLRGNSAVVEIQGTDDRDAAVALAGAMLVTERTLLPRAAGNELYEHDVIGLEVYAKDGTPLGRVVEIVATGANDVWVVRGTRLELLVPAVAHAVLELDTERRRVIIDPDAAFASD